MSSALRLFKRTILHRRTSRSTPTGQADEAIEAARTTMPLSQNPINRGFRPGEIGTPFRAVERPAFIADRVQRDGQVLVHSSVHAPPVPRRGTLSMLQRATDGLRDPVISRPRGRIHTASHSITVPCDACSNCGPRVGNRAAGPSLRQSRERKSADSFTNGLGVKRARLDL